MTLHHVDSVHATVRVSSDNNNVSIEEPLQEHPFT